MRFFNSLRPPNIERSDNTYRRIRAILFPSMVVTADDVEPLVVTRPRRPGARETWTDTAAVNARRNLVTRGRRMMTTDGVPCKDDEDAKKYVLSSLWRLPASTGRINTVTLAWSVCKENGESDVMTYCLGGDWAYLCRFRRASDVQREVWCRLIRQAALAARVKGDVKDVKQNQTVVKERVAVMGLGENGYMTYHLGQ